MLFGPCTALYDQDVSQYTERWEIKFTVHTLIAHLRGNTLRLRPFNVEL